MPLSYSCCAKQVSIRSRLPATTKSRWKRSPTLTRLCSPPDPGIPSEAGLLLPLIREYAPSKSILGICLGEQAIGEAFGATLSNLKEVYHGIASQIHVVAPDPLFAGLPETFEAGRYHSWIVDKENFPEELEITAEDDNGRIMALAHRRYDVRGLQFHPESVLTPVSRSLIENWLKA